MYRLGHRHTRHYILYAAIVVAVLLVVASIWGARYLFPSNTRITQSPAVIRHVTASDRPKLHIAKSVFAFDLPSGWQSVAPPSVPYTVYSWIGDPAGLDNARRLDVYVDSIPASLAVNRLLPVEANSDHIDVMGTTSDNCVGFTDKTAESTHSGAALSKWNGVNFWCDMSNYERDVVATGSAEGVNQVTPVGLTAGPHRILLVYTDNSGNPDYSVFEAIVHSFHLI